MELNFNSYIKGFANENRLLNEKAEMGNTTYLHLK